MQNAAVMLGHRQMDIVGYHQKSHALAKFQEIC